jgi:peptidoglycan hydrolase-like protein with peptidoglycan-binding domain
VWAAIAYTKKRFDHRSVRIIQLIAGADPDGDFGPRSAQAVARFQEDRHLLPADGMVGEETLEPLIAAQADAPNDRANAVQLVTDLFDLDVARDVLSVHFSRAVRGTVETSFGIGNLRTIRLGAAAFASAAALRESISAGLRAPAPAAGVVSERPELLSPAQIAAAVAYNADRLTDPRAVRAVQGTVGAAPDGRFGPDTAQRLAAFQRGRGLDVDGKLGRQTLEAVYDALNGERATDAAIRMLIDYFDLETTGLLDIRFVEHLRVPSGGAGGVAVNTRSRATRVLMGPGCAPGASMTDCTQSVAHELEHVRLNLLREESTAVHEFYAHTRQVLAVGLPELAWVPFLGKAQLVIERFWRRDMAAAERAAAWARFEAARAVVRRRAPAAPPDAEPQQLEFAQAVVAAYDAETRPSASPPP